MSLALGISTDSYILAVSVCHNLAREVLITSHMYHYDTSYTNLGYVALQGYIYIGKWL